MDAINQKILLALKNDGRASYTTVARKLGLKAITVTKRIEAMLKDDVIAIRAVPNPVNMGYKVMAVTTLDVKTSELDNVCAALVNNPNISSISTTFGKRDIILFSEFCDLEMLNKLVVEEIPAIKGVKAIETFIISEMKRYQISFNTQSQPIKPVVIDDVDEALINELRTNGRASFLALARKTGVSPATVSRRVASLIDQRVIEITVVPNPAKLTETIIAFVGLQVELARINDVRTQLSRYPQVPSVMTLMNGYNILAVVISPNLEVILRFISNEIARIEGVFKVETLIRAEFKKRTYLAFDLEERLQKPLS